MFANHARVAQAGFTMIELMVVVAVIGILAAFAVPQYQEYSSRTQVTRAVAELSAYKTGVEDQLARGNTVINARDIGYVQSNLVNVIDSGGLWTYEAPGRTGYLKVTMGANASAAINGAVIRLSRDARGTWTCTVTPPAQREGWRSSYVPGSCDQK